MNVFVKCAVRHCEAGRLAEDNKFCVEHWNVMCDNRNGDYVGCSLPECDAPAVHEGKDYCGEHWGKLQAWLDKKDDKEPKVTTTVLDKPVRNEKAERKEMADYYFYRCRKCQGVITRLQMQHRLQFGPEMCPCGSGMIGPTNPMGYEWLKPAVLWMTLLKLLGRLEDAPLPSQPLPVPVGVRDVPALKDEEKWADS
jgi:hypothetical protein